jgi:hypothetical protein
MGGDGRLKRHSQMQKWVKKTHTHRQEGVKKTQFTIKRKICIRAGGKKDTII